MRPQIKTAAQRWVKVLVMMFRLVGRDSVRANSRHVEPIAKRLSKVATTLALRVRSIGVAGKPAAIESHTVD